jgi:hypothetical protein
LTSSHLDAEHFAHRQHIAVILGDRAIVFQIVGFPVLHEHADHFVPGCFSNQAVTAESTPPDRPTTMRLMRCNKAASRSRSSDRAENAAGQIIGDALVNNGLRWRMRDSAISSGRHPDGAQDAVIQRGGRVKAGDLAGKGKAQIGFAGLGMLPAIDAEQRFRLEMMRGFLEHLAPHRVEQDSPSSRCPAG